MMRQSMMCKSAAFLLAALLTGSAFGQVQIEDRDSVPFDLASIEIKKPDDPKVAADISIVWAIVSPLGKKYRVFDGPSSSEIVFVGEPLGKTAIVEADQIDFASRKRTKIWYRVTSKEKPDDPPQPDVPPPPTPDPVVPVVPNKFGLGAEIYRLVMLIDPVERKKYATKVGELWESEASKLVADSRRTVEQASVSINSEQIKLIATKRTLWNDYGKFVEDQLEKLEKEGRLKRSDKSTFAEAFVEIGAALKKAGEAQ